MMPPRGESKVHEVADKQREKKGRKRSGRRTVGPHNLGLAFRMGCKIENCEILLSKDWPQLCRVHCSREQASALLGGALPCQCTPHHHSPAEALGFGVGDNTQKLRRMEIDVAC